MVAAALTDIAGSSDVVERGLVTYSNAAKSELLAVTPELIAAHGAVSGEVASAMAAGALAPAPLDLALSLPRTPRPRRRPPAKPRGLPWVRLPAHGRAATTASHALPRRPPRP